MRAIVTPAILTAFSTRVDKSLGFRGVTPELSDTEAVALMGMRGINVRLLIEPQDYASDGKVEVKGLLDSKPPSVRLRAVLFVLYQQLTKAGKIEGKSFDLFYLEQTARIINDIKAQLEPEE